MWFPPSQKPSISSSTLLPAMPRNRTEKLRSGVFVTASRLAMTAACALMLSCSDDPSAVNSLLTKFTDVDVEVVVDTLEAVESSTFRQYLSLNGSQNMLGPTVDHEARMAIQFTQSQFPQRDTIQVISAQMRLRAETWLGDSTGTLAFTAHKMLRSWAPLLLTWDSLTTGLYEESVVRGTYTGTMTTDTGYVTVDLDTSMVREWFKPSTITQYGLMLLPTTASTIIRGFSAYDPIDSARFQPTLTV